MELQIVLDEPGDLTHWSLAEVLVLLGWLSALMTCRTLICSCGLGRKQNPRGTHGEIKEAGHRRGREAPTQTTLCSPPHSLGPPPEQEEEHALWAARPRTVYSTFKRQGKKDLLQDMVVRALPVVDNLDKRRRAASSRERATEASRPQ